MTSDSTAAADGGAAGKTGTLPFDVSVAHQARMYDYLLGGKDNYAADRAAVEATLKVWPDMAFAARANRAFLGRAVRYLAGEAGIRQFLDIGTGIPTAGNTHEVAQGFAQETKDAFGNIGNGIQQGFTVRSRDQLERFFAGTDLVEPGLVPVEEWRLDPGTGSSGRSSLWGAVGRKR